MPGDLEPGRHPRLRSRLVPLQAFCVCRRVGDGAPLSSSSLLEESGGFRHETLRADSF